MPRLCELDPGICLTTEEKARKNLIWLAASRPIIMKMQSLIRNWACNEVLLETDKVILHLFHSYLDSCCRNEKALEAGPSAVKICRRKMVLRLWYPIPEVIAKKRPSFCNVVYFRQRHFSILALLGYQELTIERDVAISKDFLRGWGDQEH